MRWSALCESRCALLGVCRWSEQKTELAYLCGNRHDKPREERATVQMGERKPEEAGRAMTYQIHATWRARDTAHAAALVIAGHAECGVSTRLRFASWTRRDAGGCRMQFDEILRRDQSAAVFSTWKLAFHRAECATERSRIFEIHISAPRPKGTSTSPDCVRRSHTPTPRVLSPPLWHPLWHQLDKRHLCAGRHAI